MAREDGDEPGATAGATGASCEALPPPRASRVVVSVIIMQAHSVRGRSCCRSRLRGGSALACASIDGSYSLLRQMAHVSAQAERSGRARSATMLRWQKVSTGAGVKDECVVRTSANVPRPESHRVPDGKVRHTHVRQAAVAMRALRQCTPPARRRLRPRRTAVRATSRHGRTTS